MRLKKMAFMLAWIACSAFPAASARGQNTSAPINVFLDCQAHDCDSSHFRTELSFVNWVRDRTEADVHVLITSQGTGGGGTAYALTFIGLRAFARDTQQLGFATGQTATSAERRDLLTNRIAQGLIHYAVNTAAMDRVLIRMRDAGADDDDEKAADLAPGARDPWNHWVFSAGLDGSTNGESQQSRRSMSLELSAERVTEEWKFEIQSNGSYRENHFQLDEGPKTIITRNYENELQLTKALAPKWSAGLFASEGTSTFRNQKLFVRVAPIVEYSFMPYSEFARRRILLQYSVGANYFDYEEVTLFDKLHETVFDEKLTLATRYQQPWGSASAELEGSHYFHDLSRYELSASGDIGVRLVKGLSIEADASYSRVHNQIFLGKGDISDEDVLLERRALATAYEYDVSIGLRYTFGSIYNNIVNRRID